MLRGLELTTWQIDAERWKTLEAELRENHPFNMGTRTDGLLARFDSTRKQYVPEETGAFPFQTREGAYGAIFVGVEVRDDSLKAGGLPAPNDKTSPIAFHVGRQFEYFLIAGPDENARDIDKMK